MAASSAFTIVAAAFAAYLFSQLEFILGKGTVDVCPLIATAVSSTTQVAYPGEFLHRRGCLEYNLTFSQMTLNMKRTQSSSPYSTSKLLNVPLSLVQLRTSG